MCCGALPPVMLRHVRLPLACHGCVGTVCCTVVHCTWRVMVVLLLHIMLWCDTAWCVVVTVLLHIVSSCTATPHVAVTLLLHVVLCCDAAWHVCSHSTAVHRVITHCCLACHVSWHGAWPWCLMAQCAIPSMSRSHCHLVCHMSSHGAWPWRVVSWCVAALVCCVSVAWCMASWCGSVEWQAWHVSAWCVRHSCTAVCTTW